ncbi:MAG: SDR family NAD(P)-dependent oxidoreductase [Terriglobia bacterium]|jgi:NAD(P)-dependent dehydrogenase (short-subunit alcohol dehydrogenase family)
MEKLDGKVAIVTGASRGIGSGIARGLAKEGAQVVIANLRPEAGREAEKELLAAGLKAISIPTDVSDEAQVAALFQATVERFGRVDILVNNAGVTDGGPLDEFPVEKWDRVMAVNLRGTFLCTRSAMQVMKRQKSGRIINIGSISAQRPRANSAAYAASKFGVWGLTITTALEGREHGISACCLHPGNVRVGEEHESGVVPGIAGYEAEPKMQISEIAEVAVLMATLPPHINMLEAICLPVKQAYLGRG